MHGVDKTHRGKSCVVFSVTNIFSVEQPLLLRKKRKEKIEERTSIFPRTWLTIYSWRVSCFPSTPCYNLLFSWHSLPTTVQHPMSCRTMEHQKRELWNHQLEDIKTNRVGETRRVEGFGKEAAFIYHKYRSARHAIYPTEEIKKTLESLQKAIPGKAASQLLPFLCSKTRMNSTIQQLGDLFCHGIVPTRSTNSICLLMTAINLHAWLGVEASWQINGFCQC